MKLHLKHDMTAAAAVAHVRTTIDHHRAEINKHAQITEEKWEGNTFHFTVNIQGQSIAGTVNAIDKAYEIDVKLPMMLRLFEGKIKRLIEEQAGQLL